jgi:hypothetical protein
MNRHSLLSVILIFLLPGCVDRINVEVGVGATPIVIDGSISNQPGPYRIEIAKAIEIDSKLSVRNLISARKVTISDNLGFSEDLNEIEQGVYLTNNIQGQVGRAYKLRIETLDGRIYESKPDTIQSPTNLEQIYFNFKSEVINEATQFGFDVFFDSNIGESNNNYFLWKFVGTYQIDTNPELYSEQCGQSVCPKPRPCSGYIYTQGQLQQVGPCTCCSCWISIESELPILSDNQLINAGRIKNVKIGNVPLDSWIFMHKVHVQVQQQTLSRQAFAFWKAVIAQKAATSSLFQPISGRIPTNFVQIGGPSGQVEGLFYASGVGTVSTYISRLDVPNQGLLTDPSLKFNESCIKFGNATTQKPTFWE